MTDRTTKYLMGLGCVLLTLNLLKEDTRSVSAQQTPTPFASSIEQRQQTVEELRTLNALVRKQYELLAGGQLKVVVSDPAESPRATPGRRDGNR